MKRSITLLFILFITVTSFAQNREEAKVWQRTEDLMKAVFQTKDSVALSRLVSNELTYGHSSGVIEDRTTMIHNAATATANYKNIEVQKTALNVANNAAVVRLTFRAISADKGSESPMNLAILLVWKKQGNDWVLWARQAVKISSKS